MALKGKYEQSHVIVKVIQWLGCILFLNILAAGSIFFFEQPLSVSALKWIQFFQSAAMFLLPPLCLAYLWSEQPLEWLKVKGEKELKGERLKVKGERFREARNQIRSGIAHSDYPYTLTKPYSNRWNYAVNVLRVPDMEYKQKYAYALLDVEIHEKAESLQLVYRYSATHYKSESIRRFASLGRKYAEWRLECEN